MSLIADPLAQELLIGSLIAAGLIGIGMILGFTLRGMR